MEPQELKTRLDKLLEQVNSPPATVGTMPEDLKDAFMGFAERYAKDHTREAMIVLLVLKSVEPVLAGTLSLGFWLGHDYALEYGQLRGD